MSSRTFYDPNDSDVPNRVLNFIRSSEQAVGANTLVSADVSAVHNWNLEQDIVPRKYWLADPQNNRVVSMSQQQIDLLTAKDAAALLASLRSAAKLYVTGPDPIGKLQRSALSEIIGEFNTLITWISTFQAQTALASSLADFKTRVAGISTPSAITLNAVKTAIQNDIDSGNFD